LHPGKHLIPQQFIECTSGKILYDSENLQEEHYLYKDVIVMELIPLILGPFINHYIDYFELAKLLSCRVMCIDEE